jgi:hypothetical protein
VFDIVSVVHLQINATGWFPLKFSD